MNKINESVKSRSVNVERKGGEVMPVTDVGGILVDTQLQIASATTLQLGSGLWPHMFESGGDGFLPQ
jgi:hypothetical protein